MDARSALAYGELADMPSDEPALSVERDVHAFIVLRAGRVEGDLSELIQRLEGAVELADLQRKQLQVDQEEARTPPPASQATCLPLQAGLCKRGALRAG